MQAELYIESVLAKCVALKESGIWAPEPHVRPEAWLENFKSSPQDKLMAAIVLDNFIFYSDRASARLLAAAYNCLEDDAVLERIRDEKGKPLDVASFRFAPVEGEHPRPTDSGNTICKRLRDTLELPDERFLTPVDALDAACHGNPIVFVDDLIGSGQQLINTWQREYRDTAPKSFAEAYLASPFPVFCLAMIATATAMSNVATEAAPVVIVATHVLDGSYSIEQLTPPALVPPLTQFQSDLTAFLARHSANLTLEYFLQSHRQPLYGFHELGLLVAVQGGVPDCTVPVVWAEGPAGWIRLVRKNV